MMEVKAIGFESSALAFVSPRGIGGFDSEQQSLKPELPAGQSLLRNISGSGISERFRANFSAFAPTLPAAQSVSVESRTADYIASAEGDRFSRVNGGSRVRLSG
ncbi:MAG: hypothetical protein ACJ8M1_08340 [Chthoniobacterales bacterium]